MNPNPIHISRRAVVREDTCVACGCCVKVCPRGAIQILRGITARVNRARCIGCGKCEPRCPYHLPIREKLKKCAQDMGE